MNIVKAIYKAPILQIESYFNTTSVSIKYNGRLYTGYAYLNEEEDFNFFSEKVGKNIALSRARTKAMKTELEREKNSYREVNNFFNLKPNLLRDEDHKSLLNRKKWRCESLRTAIKNEKHNLNKYLEGQDRAIKSIKKIRNKDKEN